MTTPNNQPPTPAIPFALTGTGSATDGSGTTAANLAGRTQDAIMALLGQTQIQQSPGWTGSSQSAYAGLTPGIPFSLAIIEQFVSQITGLPIGSWTTINEALLAMEGIASNQDLQNNWTTLLTDIGVPNPSALAAWLTTIQNDIATGNFSALWTALLGGPNSSGALTSVSAPAVSNTSHSAQPVPNFPNDASLVGMSYAGGGWSWDSTVSYQGSPGCAKCTANGILQAQNGVVTAVQPGQTVSLLPAAEWSGLSAASGTSPIQAQLVTWSGTSSPGTAAAPILLAEITSPGSSSGAFTSLAPVTNPGAGVDAGVYTVPDSGVGFVQARIVVTADATTGSVWWNACDTVISGGYIATIDEGVARLQADATAATAATQAFFQALGTAVTNDAGNPSKFWTDAGAAAKVWWATESQIAQDEVVTLEQLAESALGISSATNWLMPPMSVQGVGGLQTLEDTFTSMWNQGIAAIQADLSAVGLSGFAQSLSGLAVQASNTQGVAISNATILSTVNSEPVQQNLEATVVSSGDHKLAVALSSSPITPTASLGTIVTAGQAKTFGFLQWMGEHTSALTDFVVNFYRMDTGGNLVHLFSTSDIAPGVPATMAWIVDIITALPCAATDLIGIELQVVTSGSVVAWGFTAPPAGNHPTSLVKMAGFSQNWAGAGASDIAAADIGWTQYAPYVGIGVGTPPPTPFFPQSIPYYASNTHTVPSWANFVDLVGVGPGGGGEGETGAGNGDGGTGGSWNAATLTVGVTNTIHTGMDIPAIGVITITVGVGGAGGAFFTPGSNGTATTFTWTNMAGATQTLTCAPGFGGQPSTNLTSWGLSPGNFTYTTTAPDGQSTPYIGGSLNALGGVGNTPGGGGSGGAAFQFGFRGATGQAWTVDRQT